jgi:hypothetical protein
MYQGMQDGKKGSAESFVIVFGDALYPYTSVTASGIGTEFT